MPKGLRVVSEGEKVTPPTLLEAVESGDVLAIMKAQRRIMAESLVSAQENTRPQFSQQLSKLNEQIREEESRRAVESSETSVVADLEVEKWDGTGY